MIFVILVILDLYIFFNKFIYFSLIDLFSYLYYNCKLLKIILFIIYKKLANLKKQNIILLLLLFCKFFGSMLRFSIFSSFALSISRVHPLFLYLLYLCLNLICQLLIPLLFFYYINAIDLFFHFYNINFN